MWPCPQSKELLCKDFSWRINITSDAVVLIKWEMSTNQALDTTRQWCTQDRFYAYLKTWPGYHFSSLVTIDQHLRGRVCVQAQNSLLTMHLTIALCFPGCVELMWWAVFSSGRNKPSPPISRYMFLPFLLSVLCDVRVLRSFPSQLGGWWDLLGPDCPVG